MLETMTSVGVGGLVGVAGTIAVAAMQNRKDRELQRRKEVLPIAGRALAAAQEAWGSSSQYRDSSTAMASMPSLIKRNDEARNHLLIALDELALLLPHIEQETLTLIASTSTSISPEALQRITIGN